LNNYSSNDYEKEMQKGGIKMLNKVLRATMVAALLCLIVLPVSASGWRHGHEGFQTRTMVVHPYWGGRASWGWSPYWGNVYPPFNYPMDDRGTIKIKDHDKSDQVFIDGAYAGMVEKMGTLRLKPGRYDIQIRRDGREILIQQVYVVSEKTIKIKVD
jgi:hypothetical protein